MSTGKQPHEICRELEEAWRPRVDGVSLLAELELTSQEIQLALFAVSGVWRRLGATSAQLRIPSSYATVYAAGLAGAASLLYEDGALYPAIEQLTDLHFDSNLSNQWGRLFLEALETLRLPTFPELDREHAMKYVSRILLHSGVPVSCLDDWLRQLDSAAGWVGTWDATAIYEELSERAWAGRLYQVDQPVVRFLKYGGEYAIDFLDRTIDLVLAVREERGDEIARLPGAIADRIRELVAGGRVTAPPRAGDRLHRREARAKLRFDPYGVGVHLLLPAVPAEHGVTTWRLEIDGDTRTVPARAPRPGGLTHEIELPLASTTRRVEVERETVRTVVPAVGVDDPLLVFDVTGGRRIPPGARITQDQAWVLRPISQELTVSGTARVIEELPIVPRWEGWTAQRLDVEAVSGLQVAAGRRREVASVRRPSLIDAEPLLGVVDEDGSPVLSAWPHLSLPATGGAGVDWDVLVSERRGSRRWSVRCTVGAEDQLVPLLRGEGGWPAGSVDLVVRGPLGRGLRSAFTVVPGLAITATPAFRCLTDEGLSTVDLRLLLDGGDITTDRLGPADRQATIEVPVDGHRIPLTLAPPAMAVRWIRPGEPAPWTTQRLRIEAEELLDLRGTLSLRLPPDATSGNLIIRGPSGQLLQEIPPNCRVAAGTGTFDLARTTETVERHRAVFLVIDVSGTSTVVAEVRPAWLARAVLAEPARGLLRLEGAASMEGLRAGIYRHYAPTLPPVVVDAPEGSEHVVLPDELLKSGPLRVLLRIEDPWVPADWPLFPREERNVFDVDVLDTDPDVLRKLDPLASFIAGYDREPAIVDATAALQLYWLADRLISRVPAARVRRLGSRLSGDPALALRGMFKLAVPLDVLAWIATSIGLVTAMPQAGLEDDELVDLWRRWPPLGLIGSLPVLRSGAEQARVRALEELAANACGPSFGDLLAGRSAECLNRPTFDHGSLIDFSDDLLDSLFRHAGIVPSPILDADSQALAARDLLRSIRAGRLAGLHPETILREVIDHAVKPLGIHVLTDAVHERICGPDWQVYPALSLALAAAARLEARLNERGLPGRMNAGWRRALARLAEAAPGLVSADLVMAETLLLGAER